MNLAGYNIRWQICRQNANKAIVLSIENELNEKTNL
ncbi:Uncharacterised protein [Actinobacillus equuli]|nr:Uncharacterised protein [Actinobacillus equuli]